MASVSSGDAFTQLRVVRDAEPPVADWDTVYRAHVAALFRYVYTRTGNRPDAEDVTSATFMRALPRLRPDVSDGETRAYLRATARTVLADLYRDRHGVVTQEINEEAVPNAPVGEPSDTDVEYVLSALPGNYRQVLELRFLRGYSIKETAAAMGITVSNAKVMQLRALRRAAQEPLR
jgi:RNA polymerase sigma factor (sigma-70 family)